MNKSWELRTLKAMINFSFSIIDRILKLPPARHPQTRMLQAMYKDALEVYEQHAREGVFDSSPDGNFPRFLSVAVKVLSFISEEDRYYRAWLGLAYIMAQRQLEEYSLNVTPSELKAQIKRQWLDDIGFLPDKLILQYKEDFVEIALTNSNANLLKQ